MISKEEFFHHFKLPIEYLIEKKTKKMRKLVVSDLFDIINVPAVHVTHKKLRVKKYRQQQEYGEKKQIKP